MSISVKSLTVKIDDNISNGFYIDLDDTKWKLDNFTLKQCLLSYNTLTFSMHKDPLESLSETKFNVCRQIIGKEITLSLDTDNIENLSLNASND